MKIRSLLLLISLAFGAALPAAAYTLYMPDEPEVQSLVRLYSQAGRVFPDASFPLSKADLDEYAARLLDAELDKQKALTPRLIADVRTYRRNLDFQSGREFMSVDSALEMSGLLHSKPWPEEPEVQRAGDTISGAPAYDGPGTAGANDLTRYPNDLHTRFVDFPDMLQLALAAGVQGHSGMHISAGIRREYRPDALPASNLYFIDSEKDALIENYMIRTGYLAWRGEHFEARFGRAPAHYGDSRFSTFLPGQNLPWLDTFTYRYHIGPLTMTSYFGTLENRVSDDEAALFGIGDGGAAGGAYTFDTDRTIGFDDAGQLVLNPKAVLPEDSEPLDMAFSETTILTSMHRFIFSWPKLRLGISAHSLVARERNALVMGDIFPIFSWHNGFVGHHNMHFVGEAAYTPVPGLALYGQAAWDDINASELIGIPDSSLPNIGAYLGGLAWQGSFPFGTDHPAADLSAKLEVGRTHYLWGSYYSYHPEKGGYFERAIYRYKAKEGVYWMPLTSPYGPGVVWVDAQTDVRLPSGLELALGGKYLSINSAADLLALTYERNDALEDAPRIHSYSLWARAEWTYQLSRKSDPDRTTALGLRARPVLYSYDGHLWPELELSVRLEAHRFGDW